MNILDAAHKTVKDYPGGSQALATRLVVKSADGTEKPMSAALLRSKVNPSISTHHLYLQEASEIMDLTGDYRILHALAAEHGFTLQQVDAPQSASLIGALLASNASSGDISEVLAKALADNDLSTNEATEISRAIAAAQASLGHLGALVWREAGKGRLT